MLIEICPHYSTNKKWGYYKFLKHILDNCTIRHSYLCLLTKILFVVVPSTELLDSSCRKLAKICFKDRNSITSENLETLYFLSVSKKILQLDFLEPEKFLKY